MVHESKYLTKTFPTVLITQSCTSSLLSCCCCDDRGYRTYFGLPLARCGHTGLPRRSSEPWEPGGGGRGGGREVEEGDMAVDMGRWEQTLRVDTNRHAQPHPHLSCSHLYRLWRYWWILSRTLWIVIFVRILSVKTVSKQVVVLTGVAQLLKLRSGHIWFGLVKLPSFGQAWFALGELIWV